MDCACSISGGRIERGSDFDSWEDFALFVFFGEESSYFEILGGRVSSDFISFFLSFF